jgi:hypothetical protein
MGTGMYKEPDNTIKRVGDHPDSCGGGRPSPGQNPLFSSAGDTI